MVMVMTAGRPTSYTEDMQIKAQSYIDTKQPTIHSAVGLCRHLGVSRQTIYDWGDKHPEFLDILSQVNELQEQELLDGGLSGGFNATIAKLVLGKHGYRDTVQQETVVTNVVVDDKALKQAVDDVRRDYGGA